MISVRGRLRREQMNGVVRTLCVMPNSVPWWKLLFFAIACATLLCRPAFCQTPQTKKAVLDFHAPAGDGYAGEIREDAEESVKQIEAFFGKPYPDAIHFDVVTTRAEFNKDVARWGLSPTQCWMVGVGTADLMVVLSPADWANETCEHDAKDAEATRLLVKHELVHVYHGQHNKARDFTGIDDLDWFIEGLAVYVSGQITPDRMARMQAAVAAGQAPASLSKVWAGLNRYAFAGSLVRYVDRKWGREMTFRLMQARSQAEALRMLGTNEKTLLAGWEASLQAAVPAKR
jgi:hypothetical protein